MNVWLIKGLRFILVRLPSLVAFGLLLLMAAAPFIRAGQRRARKKTTPRRHGSKKMRWLRFCAGNWMRWVPSSEIRAGWRRRIAWIFRTLGERALVSGDLELAARCLEYELQLISPESARSLSDHRVLGATYFMLGELDRAKRAFELAGLHRQMVLAKGGMGSVRLLGSGWLVAIGHVCMLDFYFKMRELGWLPEVRKVFLDAPLAPIPGGLIAREYQPYGLEFALKKGWPQIYDKVKQEQELNWNQLTLDQQFALRDDFWEYRMPNGDVLPYTHGAAIVQQTWEAQGRGPLLKLDQAKRDALRSLLDEMSIPRDAWYVCLHVREPGFHASWNSKYPSARDADIDDYQVAIDAVRERGGWIVRVGDPTMKRLPKMDRVFDYAHSHLKSQIGDLVLPVGGRFFLGTNSGYATVPGIYGVPNLLTNWIPVALPLWFSQDVMIPKMFWNKVENRYLGFAEMFGSKIGAMQNILDFPEEIEVRNNTVEEIRAATLEMLDRCENKAIYTEEDEERQRRYHDLARRHGSYWGSRVGRDFLRHYHGLLGDS
jgi:putative glycosyltransferase (TIGR04372 family)